MTDRNKSGPLCGIKVIELAALGPVPFSGMMLADLGAEVIRIERPGASVLGVPMEQRFDIMSRGRRSIALDLTRPEGMEVVLQLVATADVLMEGMRPGAMERLGLGPEECLARNPGLIYGRMTGWGQTGPLAQRAGHDINYLSINGVLDSIGLEGQAPVPPINLVGDYGGGSMFLITGILAALLEARTSGKGQVIDAAMLEGSSYLLTTIHMFTGAGMWQAERGTNLLDSGAPFYCVYETSDGKHMAVGAIESRFYAEFVAGLGLDIDSLPPPLERKQWRSLKQIFAQVFLTKTRGEWSVIFANRDACVTPVLSIAESVEHKQNCYRNNFVNISGVTQPNLAPRFSRTETRVDGQPTPPGGQGREILRELGMPEQQIDDFARQHIVCLPED